MQYTRSDEVLRRMFQARGLAPEALEPWGAWKIFKAYLRVPIDATILASDEQVEFWTQDASSLSAFIDRVEADRGFQSLMNAHSSRSWVYAEEH